MGLQISPLEFLDFQAVFDLSLPTPTITITNLSFQLIQPSVNNKVWFEVKTPSGVMMHQGSITSPDETSIVGWQTFVIPEPWPQPFYQIEFSGAPYQITMFYDFGGTGINIKSLTKKATITRPGCNTKDSQNNFGQAKVFSNVLCDKARLYVRDETNYLYQGKVGELDSAKYVLAYPYDTETLSTPSPFVLNGMTEGLLTLINNGTGHNLYYDVVRKYDLGDFMFVKIKYKYHNQFAVLCNVDLCPLVCGYKDLLGKVDRGECGDQNIADMRQKLAIINGKINLALIAIQQPCEIDVPSLLEEIKKDLGLNCNCYCTTKGIHSETLNKNIDIVAGCGDIVVDKQVTGDNILYTISDMSYDFKMCDDSITSGKTHGVEIHKTVDGCKTTFCLDFINFARSSSIEIVPPEGGIVYPNPTKMPPVTDFITGVQYSPNLVFTDATSLVAAWNMDTTLNAMAQAVYISETQIGLQLVDGVELPEDFALQMGPVYDDAANTYKQALQLKDADDNVLAAPAYPFAAKVQVTVSGVTNTYYTPLVNNYAQLATALAALPISAMAISAVSTASNANTVFMALQSSVTNISQAASFNITIINAAAIAIGANNQLGTTNSGGIVWFDISSGTVLGKLDGYPNTHNAFHIIRRANMLYVVEGDTGRLLKIDCTFPLFPTYSTLQLPAHANSWSASPVISPGSQKSFFDVMFPHEDTYYDAFLYILEASSGQMLRVDPMYNTIVDKQDDRLLGKRPCIIENGYLYFCQFGNLESGIGATSGVDRWEIVKLDITAFNGGTFSTFLTVIDVFGSDGGGEEAWIILRKWNTGQVFIIGKFGSIYEWDCATDTRVDALNPTQTWNLGSVPFKPTGAVFVGDVMYIATRDQGTFMVDFTDWPTSVTITPFEDLVVNASVNKIHTSVLPLPAFGLLLVTFENGTNPGGMARYDMQGHFIDVITQAQGGFYNAVLFPSNGPTTPNGLI